MHIEQMHWNSASGWVPQPSEGTLGAAQLVLVFGSRALLMQPSHREQIRAWYPAATLVGCSTAGEIYDTQVLDDSLVVTAIQFSSSHVASAMVPIAHVGQSHDAGAQLAQQLPPDDLAHVLVFSEGLHVNGSELVHGLIQNLPPHVRVTGGLSADGPHFNQTCVLYNEVASPDMVVAVGLYGQHLQVGYGSMGGWDSFGPERLVTRAEANVLYELDGTSALALYKRYLGEHAADLPASGLLFPLSISAGPGEPSIVRTILAVNEADQSITFAGDIPEGAYARLMRANFDRLIDGAIGAASSSVQRIGDFTAELALLISCVGRKLVLQQRIEEEVEGVRETLGAQPVLTGFYSYGEISLLEATGDCALHNQTMTITLLSEAP